MNFKDIYIYTSKDDYDRVNLIVSEILFNDVYYTPAAEFKINPVWKNINDINKHPEYSTIMLISLEDSIETTSKIIFDHLKKNIDYKGAMFLVNDYFATNQLMFMIDSKDENSFKEDLIKQRSWILNNIKDQEQLYFDNRKNKVNHNLEISKIIEEKFDIQMYVQEDYQRIGSSEKDQSIWIGRTFPYRWIYIYKDSTNNYFTPDKAWKRIALEFEDNLNVDIMAYNRDFETIKFDSFAAKKISGVYGTKIESENFTGGPFMTYILNNNKTNEVIVVSGFVNSPGNSKVYHIKELEYIIETIKESNNE